MPYATIAEHEVEYEGVAIAGTPQWAAYLTIYGSSANPMHRNSLFPRQHVAVDEVFLTKEAAEEGALKVARTLLQSKAASN
ncbi:MAG TPA: hypothetical protein VHL60_02495 [Oxalicibacterium sp.]|jgi:hypothetical protein|nr:hypothetical protein [Oxalicibacterium sp.]